MKATGIVRRIDDLGRIVIPKEIRRTLRIRETDPMEIYTDMDGQIVLKKYSPMADVSEFAVEYAESIAQNTGMTIAITDRDCVIAAAGTQKKNVHMSAQKIRRNFNYSFLALAKLLFLVIAKHNNHTQNISGTYYRSR